MTAHAAAVAEPDRRRPDAAPGEEELRFIRNFHDVFLALGLAMFAVGLALATGLLLGGRLEGGSPEAVRRSAFLIAAAMAADAVVMWALGEVFARTRRLFLPSIVVLLAFAGFVAAGATIGYLAALAPADLTIEGDVEAEAFLGSADAMRYFLTVGFGAASLASLAFYLRTKLPFAAGFCAVLAVYAAGSAFLLRGVETLADDPARLPGVIANLSLAGGALLFLMGLAFDARDPERRTRFSDNAFWMHFFAAPLLYAGALYRTTGEFALGARFDDGGAATTLTLVLVFAVVSILINRRALLVAGLLSAVFASGQLLSRAGLDGAWVVAVTLLLLGGAMVLLGGGWHTVRRALVAPFPKSGFLSRIVPPEPPRGGATAVTE